MWSKGIQIVAAILSVFIVFGCQSKTHNEQDLMRVKSANREYSKKVILLMADSLMAQAIDRGVSQNILPAFQFLIGRGQYYKDMVSSFPTMSVTIDSSLLTGKYPDEHHVPGLIWYSADDRKLINYGTGPMEVLRHGVDPVLVDALIDLNKSHLNPNLPTIYEDLARRGLTSGSVNGLIYRGPSNHTLSIPGWLSGLTSLPEEIQVKGPDFLSLGALSNPLKENRKLPDGLTNRIGLNNNFAMETVKYLVRNNRLPDFLFVYLPDMDRDMHKKGPSEMKGIQEVDRQLMDLLQSFGSPEKALNEAIFIIVGDSGMTQILPADQNPVIDLVSLLGESLVLRLGEAVSEETEFILAVNETMAYVYPIKAGRSLRDTAELIVTDPRIDFIAWKEGEWVYTIEGANSQQLKFKTNGSLVDSYNQSWTLEQDGSMLDLKVNQANNTLGYGQYPDVLKRLSGALNSHEGEFLIVTAKPGYELADRSSPTHKGGGGHGSIRSMESLVPLIICGTDRKPVHLRIIDLKAYLLDLLGEEVQ